MLKSMDKAMLILYSMILVVIGMVGGLAIARHGSVAEYVFSIIALLVVLVLLTTSYMKHRHEYK